MLQIAGMYGCLSVPEGISHIELGPRCHTSLFSINMMIHVWVDDPSKVIQESHSSSTVLMDERVIQASLQTD